MTATGPSQPADDPMTTLVPEPRRRVFRRLTFGGRLADFAWRWTKRLAFHPSPASFYAWRRWVLRIFGAKVHPTAIIHRSVRIIHPWNLTLHKGVVVLHGVVLDCQSPIKIGEDTRVSQLTYLCTATHSYEERHMPIIGRPILIGSRCWLAADVFVGCGVNIGDGSVLGARSSVFRDVPPGVVMAGTPAKLIGPAPQVQHSRVQS